MFQLLYASQELQIQKPWLFQTLKPILSKSIGVPRMELLATGIYILYKSYPILVVMYSWSLKLAILLHRFNVTSQSNFLTYQNSEQLQSTNHTEAHLEPGNSYTISVTSVSRVNAEIPNFENLENIAQARVITGKKMISLIVSHKEI